MTMRDERDEREIATMRAEREVRRCAMSATMRDEREIATMREIATGDKTALQSPASWWGFLFG